MIRPTLAACSAVLFAAACGRAPHGAMFKLLSPGQTGVRFANTVTTDDTLNVQAYYYVYNGGGVAVGDINNDGLPDLLFTGNMVSSRLYLNKGHMRFEDITDRAGLHTSRWTSGAAMVDINGDGYLDIYMSVTGPTWAKPADRTNLLFINNGNDTFTEAAAKYHLDRSGFTTQGVFFDYDRDGDLDLFLVGNSPEDFSRGAAEIHPAGIQRRSPDGYDRLYRNNGDGTFTDVSQAAGILTRVGYGLGAVVTDIDGDGWPDLYISNDDAPNDLLYVNNRDGTFTDRAGAWIKHASFAGMGLDIADFNNDGRPDILQTDMMPESLPWRKRMSGALTMGRMMEFRSKGFRDDYQVNTLQLNNGGTPTGEPRFSEIASLAGVAYTDWSWSALFADFDNDGNKDILITNGYPKAVNDFDYQGAMFREKRRATPADLAASHRRGLEILARLRSYQVSNHVFRNAGDLTFRDETKAWGMDQPSFSYGAAYVDLNNDGKLDVVVNNIDAPAFIYENVQPAADSAHYLAVALKGDAPNTRGIGSHVVLTAGGKRQYLYATPYRGYLSTVDDRLHFGLGHATRVDTLQVTWPDGRVQTLTNLDVDRLVTVKQNDATKPTRLRPIPDTRYLFFRQADPRHTPAYDHRPGDLDDFSVQSLLPYMISRQGPVLAVADVNGDGLEDLFVGGGDVTRGGTASALFTQRRDGSFVKTTLGEDSDAWGAAFLDANGDGRPDLYVATCGYALSPVSRLLQDRLYVNRGAGRLVLDTTALPDMPTCTAAVATGDFTGDGKPDLFVGGRLSPRNYPYPARSYLLRNDGGTFTDVTAEVAPDLAQPVGMITAAVWVDLDGDGRLDLVTAGEWMGLEFYHNDGRQLHNVTAAMHLPPLRGWWASLAVGDFNHDGHPDVVAGNLGLNHTYQASAAHPFGVYAGDFTGDRSTEVILTRDVGGKDYPLFGLATYGRAIYTIGLKFRSSAAFSVASIDQILSPGRIRAALHYQADTFASVYLQNDGHGSFTVTPLPSLAQIAPIRGIVADDVDGDGNLDLLVAGNLYDTEPNTPRQDAGNGLWLRGDGRGRFTSVSPALSGFLAPQDVTGLALVKTPAGKTVFVANNGASLQAFTLRSR